MLPPLQFPVPDWSSDAFVPRLSNICCIFQLKQLHTNSAIQVAEYDFLGTLMAIDARHEQSSRSQATATSTICPLYFCVHKLYPNSNCSKANSDVPSTWLTGDGTHLSHNQNLVNSAIHQETNNDYLVPNSGSPQI